jgi:hypothetical protein
MDNHLNRCSHTRRAKLSDFNLERPRNADVPVGSSPLKADEDVGVPGRRLLFSERRQPHATCVSGSANRAITRDGKATLKVEMGSTCGLASHRRRFSNVERGPEKFRAAQLPGVGRLQAAASWKRRLALGALSSDTDFPVATGWRCNNFVGFVAKHCIERLPGKIG